MGGVRHSDWRKRNGGAPDAPKSCDDGSVGSTSAVTCHAKGQVKLGQCTTLMKLCR